MCAEDTALEPALHPSRPGLTLNSGAEGQDPTWFLTLIIKEMSDELWPREGDLGESLGWGLPG